MYTKEQQEIVNYINLKDKELNYRIQSRVEPLLKPLREKVMLKLRQCTNSGKSQKYCQQMYLSQTPEVVQSEQRIHQCMAKGVFPISDKSKLVIDQCFKKAEPDMQQSLLLSIKRLENLTK